MITLDILFEKYCDFNRKDGKIINSNSYPFVRKFIRFSKTICYSEYLDQEVVDDWSVQNKNESVKSFNQRIASIQQFLLFSNRSGYSSIIIPKKIKIEHHIDIVKQSEKPFAKSLISDYLTEYVEWIKSTGAYTKQKHDTLIRFNKELIKKFPNAKEFTSDMVSLIFAKHPNENARSCNLRNKPTVNFLEYANWKRLLNIEIPPNLKCINRYERIPHAFSEEELKQLFYLADHLRPHKWEDDIHLKYRRLLAAVYFRLLYSTGMRTNEAVNLRRENVDLDNGIINIESTKGYHQHRVALHSSMTEILRQYDKEMDKIIPERMAFFPNFDGEFLSNQWQSSVFNSIWKDISDSDARAYDLRSNYAVMNINGWHLGEPKWIDKFVYLSRSMGHTNLTRTSEYYRLVPMFREKLEEQSGKNLKKLLPNMEDFLDNQE